MTSFTVAVDDGKDANGTRRTQFIDCVAWKQTAELVAGKFDKGQRIALAGSLSVREYTTKDGDKRRTVEVTAREVYFCESLRTGSAPAPQQREDFSSTDDDYLF